MKSPSPNRLNRRLRAGAAALAFLGILWGGAAHAAGTLSGTDITNLAKLTFSVGAIPQNAICSSPTGNSTSNGDTGAAACVTGTNGALVTTFKVDNKVNLSLTEVSANATPVTPGAINQATGFLLTNTGNTAQGYNLTAAVVPGATTFTVLSTFVTTNVRIFLDSDNDGVLSPAELGAGAITSIASLAPDGTVRLLVVSDIPAALVNGAQATVSLTALARTATTLTALTQAANTQAGVEIVFGDAATVANASGTDPGQVAGDAQAVARDAYLVQAALISITKTATPICDPFNGNTSPKNIPGSAVQYAITITNAAGAGASATLSQIQDVLNVANLDFDPGLISGVGAGAVCIAGTGNQAPGVGFGAVRGTGTVITTYVAPGPNSVAQAVTAGATFASPNVVINFATLAGTAYGAANATLAPNSFVTVYFNAFVK